MAVSYEWDVETFDLESDDILDHSHMDKPVPPSSLCECERLVLVRDDGTDDEGLIDRLWAYVEDDMLPKHFENGAGIETQVRVPKRFHKQLERVLK